MFTCKVRLGYDPELSSPATLTVTEKELVINESGKAPVILAPEEVVSFEIKGLIPFVTQVVLVHCVARNGNGKLVMMPLMTTCRRVMEGIRSAGFIPNGEA